MPPKKACKRSRDESGPLTQPTPHIVAKATARDAIVAFGAGYNALSIPFERRVARYLRSDHLYAVGGRDDDDTRLSSVECYDPSTNVWSVVAPMSTVRAGHGVAGLGGFLYAVGGHDGTRDLSSVERFDPSTNVWSVVAAMTTTRFALGAVAI